MKAVTGIYTGEPNWTKSPRVVVSQSLAKPWMPEDYGTRLLTQLGRALTREFSLIPPSTSGTPAQKEVESTARTHVLSTCS